MTPRHPTRAMTRIVLVTALVVLTGLLPATAVAQSGSRDTGDVCPPPGTSGEDRFPDDDGSVHEDNIDCIAQYGIVRGRSDGTYAPQDEVSRAQMATYIANFVEVAQAAELPEGDDAFADDAGSTHEASINKIANAGIVEGVSGDEYAPDRAVTRAQLATFVASAIRFVIGEDLPAGDDAFEDDDGSTHEPSIDALAAQRIVSGVADGRYEPNRAVARGPLASFVAHAADYVAEEHHAWSPTTPFELSLATTTVAQGQAIDGEIVVPDGSDASIDEASVAGCGLGRTVLEDTDPVASGVQFSVEIPSGQDPGDCTLTFEIVFDDGADGRTTRLVTIAEASRDVTDAPELLAVTTASQGGDQIALRFTFDEPLRDTVVAERFRLADVTGRQTGAISARPADDASSAVASFAVDAYETAAVASVAHRAVQDEEGLFNPEASVGVNEIHLPAMTAAPDLREVRVQAADSSATFVFDAPAAVEDDDAATYHLVLDDGRVLHGTPASGRGTREHRVRFDELDGEDAGDVRRGYVEAGTVASTGGDAQTNPQQSVPVAERGITATPDVVNIAVDSENDLVSYTFDENVDLVTNALGRVRGRFRIHYLDGSEAVSRDAEKTAPRTITVTFRDGGAGLVTATVVGATVDVGTVSSGADGDENAVDGIGIDLFFAPGRTAAPDLLDVDREERSGPLGSTNLVMTFTFDQTPSIETRDGFAVYGADGARTALPPGRGGPSGCQEADGDAVTCTVNSLESEDAFAAAREAVLATVVSDAVRGDRGLYANTAAAAPF